MLLKLFGSLLEMSIKPEEIKGNLKKPQSQSFVLKYSFPDLLGVFTFIC